MKVRGKLIWNPKGYGFVESKGLSEDVFIPPEGLNSALDGDLVEVDVYRDRKGLRGRVSSVLDRTRLSISGRYIKLRKFGVLEPAKPFPYAIHIPLGAEGDARNGDMVVATIIPPKAAGRVSALTAKVERSLDIPSDVGEDLQLVAAKFGLSWRFPEEVEREAHKASRIDMAGELSRRRDLRDRVLFTIDGINAKDFDDAVGIETLEDGTHLLTVAIADVAQVVKDGTLLDREARSRSFSVYFPEIAIPMLPEVLSNGVMSLKPREDRLAVVVEIRIGPKGKVISYDCFEAVIRSRARLTYEEVGPFLEGISSGSGFDEEVSSRLLLLHRLTEHLTVKRRKRGSLDFDLAAVDITMDSAGLVESINRIRHGPAEKLIEEAMLLANQTVCSFLRKHHMPILYRVHEKPKREDLFELLETLSEIGLSPELSTRLKKAAQSGDKVSEALQAISEAYSGGHLEAFVHLHILRSLARARYSPEDVGHFGLACSGYLHFTSPIRRYPDLIIHRLVKMALKSQSITGKDQAREVKNLKRIAPEVSDKEQQTDSAMMEASKLKMAAYMAGHMGEEFEAVITSIFPYGMFIEVLDPPVDGLVRTQETFDPEARKSRRSRAKKQAPTIGQIVPVKLIRADRSTGQLEFIFA
jgi:ribonuclease R